MALEFIPTSDVKMTVEKEVKPKPSVTELTTIESPGKPIPASVIAEQENEVIKKKPRKKPKTTAPAEQRKEAILIITEKPQAALKIASALGDARKYMENGVPYYEVVRNGQKLIVASAVGHLFNLTYSKGQVGWPIFKMEWEPSFKKTTFTKKYYDLLKKVSMQAKEVIIATDYDVEGELIGWNALRFITKRNDAKRMKFSTLTKPELVRAFENPLETLDWGQAYAGETRHQIDWLYGINLSRALMSAIKKSGSFRILSIGRIQGPALKVIVDREREIYSFKSTPYWNVFAHANNVIFKHPKDIIDKNELSEFDSIKEANADTKKRDETVSPPYPFDLTTLQREAYAWHYISPSKTLQVAQSLYLDGLISYPRTSSQKIPKEIEPQKILKALEKKYPQASHISRSLPVEGPKSDPAHPSIYPTGEHKKLEGDEKKIYDLIVRRFISAFSADAFLARKTVTLTAGDKKFTASGCKIDKKGWMDVYPSSTEEVDLEDMSGKVKIDKIDKVEKETQPPKRYTPTSLITILEKKNLGTKTTRSLIIDTLFNRGYLEGKTLEATPLGMKLIDATEKYAPIIVDENLTRDLEEKMEEIQSHTNPQVLAEKSKNIRENVEKLIADISKDFKAHEAEIGASLNQGNVELREMQKENSVIMPCPVCGKGNLVIKYSKKIGKYFAACDQYPACKTTHSLPPNALIKRTDKKSPEGLPILIALRKGRKPWEFVFDPNYKKTNDSANGEQSNK